MAIVWLNTGRVAKNIRDCRGWCNRKEVRISHSKLLDPSPEVIPRHMAIAIDIDGDASFFFKKCQCVKRHKASIPLGTLKRRIRPSFFCKKAGGVICVP